MTDRIKGAVLGAVIAALLVLLVVSFSLHHEWQIEKTRADKLEQDLTNANAATKACNDSIAGLEKAALKRNEVADRERDRARARASSLERRAQRELSTPPAVPGDDCKSAQERVRRILAERGKP